MESLLPPPLEPYGDLIVGIATAIVIFVVGWIASKWAATLGLRVLRGRKIDEAVARFLSSMVQYAILAATVVAALAKVGVETTSLVAILGSAALAVGLALQGSLANFASGVMLLLFRPFTIGDAVTLNGQFGTVDEVGLYATTMHNPDNFAITIPNAQVMNGTIINHTVRGTRRAKIDVGVAYGTDPQRVMDVLIDAVKNLENALEDPAPGAFLAEYGASSVNYSVTVWANSADWWGVLCSAKVAVYNALGEAGIEIPFDQVVVHQAPEDDASAAA